jgi:uncharacterized protein (DUF305 family)
MIASPAAPAAPTHRADGARRRVRSWAPPALALLVALAVWAVVAIVDSSRPATPAFSFTVPGTVDIGFAQSMIEHHSQAVTMSQIVAQAPGASAEVKALASSIQTVQLQQIGMMQGWLGLWDAPPVPRGDPMLWMEPAMERAMAADPKMAMPATAMPGMATQTELNRLATLRGRAADVLFLQLMTRHHEAGVVMSRYAAAHARVAQVGALATQMVLDQTQEITLMTALLARDHASPLPFHG